MLWNKPLRQKTRQNRSHMHKRCVLAVLLGLVHANIGGERITIHFSDDRGRVVETRDYNVHRMIFVVSAYMKEEAEKYQCSVSEQERQSGQAEVRLAWDPFMFEIVASLLDNEPLDYHMEGQDVANVLRLASLLKIQDEKMRLYRNLAGAVVNEWSLRAELEAYKDVPDIKLFVLQLLRESAGHYEVDLRVCGNRAKLCPAIGYQCEESWQRDKISVVDTIIILNSAMSTLLAKDIEFVGALRFYVHIMDIHALEIDFCRPSRGMIGCIGSMRSLTRLSMKGFGGDVLCGLSQLARLTNLTELDIEGNKMSRKRLRKIGVLTNLTKLNIENCGLGAGRCSGRCSADLRCIEGLERLTELNVSRNKLKASDMRVIGEMRDLRKLKIDHCHLKAGTIKHLRDLKCLEELDISENMLSKGDLDAIGKLESLLRLHMNKCNWKPWLKRLTFKACSLERLNGLCNLTKLSVSGTILNKKDMVGIGKIQNLEYLNMMQCSIKRGSIGKLQGLSKLKKLCVLNVRELRKMSKKDKGAICALEQRGTRVEIF